MNVCIFGPRGDQLDEGTKNVSVHLHRRLRRRGVDATLVDLREVGNGALRRSLVDVDPDVVHLVPGPTGRELAFLRALSLLKRCESVVTATQPRFNALSKSFLPYLDPSLVFVQSSADRSRFEALGYLTEFLPIGVDLSRFSPVDAAERARLREDLDLPETGRLFLHVGHVERNRGVRSLLGLRQYGHLVVVGSPSTGPERDLVASLRDAGVTVRTDYVSAIEKYHRAADVYLFPVQEEANSIRTPLSVLEAMACNRPVVSTRFGGLTDLFDEGDGLRFVDSFADVSESDLTFSGVDTRDKVRRYSWDAVAEQVIAAYERLCA